MESNMIRHIRETPKALEDSLVAALPEVDEHCARLKTEGLGGIVITGCGASYHAALGARPAFEALLDTSVSALPASEVSYDSGRSPGARQLMIAVSRSGEKGDVMNAVRAAKGARARVLAVAATSDSLLAREADHVILTREGPEHCQPKTKSFVSALGVLNLMAAGLAGSHGHGASLLDALRQMPAVIASLIESVEGAVRRMAAEFKECEHMFVTGTRANLGAVLEAALKLKETSFIHAEGMPTGEAAQGPLVLLNRSWGYLSFVSAPGRDLATRILAAARRKQARTVAVAEDTSGLEDVADHVLSIPPLPSPLLAPMAYIIPAQLLAYCVAVEKGLDADQPEGFDLVLDLILEPGRSEPEMREKEATTMADDKGNKRKKDEKPLKVKDLDNKGKGSPKGGSFKVGKPEVISISNMGN